MSPAACWWPTAVWSLSEGSFLSSSSACNIIGAFPCGVQGQRRCTATPWSLTGPACKVCACHLFACALPVAGHPGVKVSGLMLDWPICQSRPSEMQRQVVLLFIRLAHSEKLDLMQQGGSTASTYLGFGMHGVTLLLDNSSR